MLGGDVDELYGKLKAWDMSIVKRYAVEHGSYTADEIDEVEAEYKRFLALTLAYPKTRIPVAGKVDTLWHTHIIFTNDYRAMGDMVGGYIDHRPSILDAGMDMNAEFADMTIPLYELHFGIANRKIWSKALCCSSSSGCSGNHATGDLSGHVNN
jgi:hypothetical protein